LIYFSIIRFWWSDGSDVALKNAHDMIFGGVIYKENETITIITYRAESIEEDIIKLLIFFCELFEREAIAGRIQNPRIIVRTFHTGM